MHAFPPNASVTVGAPFGEELMTVLQQRGGGAQKVGELLHALRCGRVGVAGCMLHFRLSTDVTSAHAQTYNR